MEKIQGKFTPLLAVIILVAIAAAVYFYRTVDAPVISNNESSTITGSEVSFVTPVESQNLTRGSAFVIILDGAYSDKMELSIVSTPAGSTFKQVVDDNVSEFDRRKQVVWSIPCNLDRSQGWYRLVLSDIKTKKVIAESPAFGFSPYNSSFCDTQ